MIRKILFCCIVFVASSSLLYAEDEKAPKSFSASSNLTFVNNYYWRGEYGYPDGVPAFQPEATLTYEKLPLSLNIWSSIPLKKRKELAVVKDELDLQLSGDINLTKSLTLTLGFELYAYPFASVFSHTEELYAVFLYELPRGFALEWDAYVGVNPLRGVYLAFLPTYQTSIAEELNLKFQMLLGYTNNNLSSPKFVELGFKTGLSWQFSEYASLDASLLYNYNYSASKNLYAASLGLGFGI